MARKFIHEETETVIEVLLDVQVDALINEGFKEITEVEPKKKK